MHKDLIAKDQVRKGRVNGVNFSENFFQPCINSVQSISKKEKNQLRFILGNYGQNYSHVEPIIYNADNTDQIAHSIIQKVLYLLS